MSAKNAMPVTKELIREFTGHDVLCLHAICQPLTSQMQAVIRHQRDQLERAVEAMEYSLRVQGQALLGTQQFTNLTAMVSELTDQDVDAVRNRWIPNSANMHREREV